MTSAPFIQVEELSKVYGDGNYALQNVSLNIEKGEVFGIIGLSGAGKSTLLRTLARLIVPTSGKVLFHGQNIFDFDKQKLHEFRCKSGMVFQHFNLLSSRSVFGNIALPLEISGFPKEKITTRVIELLHLVGLEKKKDTYPSSLSGGERQRVGIARALATNPEVLFCDEATSALDPKTTKEILDLLSDLNRTIGVTIVLITHEMEVIKHLCHKVAVIENGGIIEQGSVVDVFTEPKHPTTKRFVQGTRHDIPEHLLKTPSTTRKLLRLSFKGDSAGKPVISYMIRECGIDANILLGWVENLQMSTVGILVIEITGEEASIEKALAYLHTNKVHCEVMA